MLLWIFVLTLCYSLSASQECSSPTFSFTSYVHPELLDLTTAPNTVIASFAVEHVRSVSIVTQPSYIGARIVESELQFLTTDAFAEYEEHEVQFFIIIQVAYQCSSGQRQGIYRHSLKLANNHAPRFLLESYEALVPLPLPKQFDLSPYLASGNGVMARDIDLINNTVTFGVNENAYVFIESRTIPGDPKQFKAILRLKEQVLTMPEKLELIVTATDAGVPAKTSQVSVTIEPDLSIVYDDPPLFKETFINRTLEAGLLIRLELVPGTETNDVLYSLEGADAQYFTLMVWPNNTGVDLRLIGVDNLPKFKTFLSVVAVAKRTELQQASCVILLSIPSASNPDTSHVTVEKVLGVLQLKEMSQHRDIFPLAIKNCVYGIQSQSPGEYFFVQEVESSLASKPFDREDKELFEGLDMPQFWIVLELKCPNQSAPAPSVSNWTGPKRDIDFTTDLTHLNVIVEDINDNSPLFTYPVNNARFAFPPPRLWQQMLPDRLLTVEATDLDDGLNALIRYSLAMNDHFDIDPHTGVIFPLNAVLAKENSITLDVAATDRDGAEDGNISTMKIVVQRASEDQLASLTINGMDPYMLDKTLEEISAKEGVKIGTLKNAFSTAEDDGQTTRRSADARFITSAIVYAFSKDQLLSYDEMNSIFGKLEMNFTSKLSKISELFAVQTVVNDSVSNPIYPYIIVAAFFGALAIAMGAAVFYYRAKSRQPGVANTVIAPSRSSTGSDAIIKENEFSISSSTPPMTATVNSESIDTVRSLTELSAIHEDLENEKSNIDIASACLRDRKKSIKFNETVERIEVFDK